MSFICVLTFLRFYVFTLLRLYAFALFASGTHVVSHRALKRSNEAASQLAYVPLPAARLLAKARAVPLLVERQIRVIHQPPGMQRAGLALVSLATCAATGADHQHPAGRRVAALLGAGAAMLAGVHHQLSLELLELEDDEESQELLELDQSLLLELLEQSWCRCVSFEVAAMVAK